MKFVRDNQKEVEEMLAKRGMKIDLAHIIETDDARKKLIVAVEELRRTRREVAEKKDIEKGRKIKEELSKKEEDLAGVEEELKEKLLTVPNILHLAVPIGDESANKVIKKVGDLPKFDFQVKDHLEIGESLDLIDIPRAAKVSGSRFGYLKNEAALLEFALVQFTFKTLVKEGFTPVVPPTLIKKEMTDGLGYWQGGGNENYYLVSDFGIGGAEEGKALPLYLIGTGEHAVVPMHSEETLDGKDLPKRYAAFSSCFRREAGSYGKDTRGIFRVHQFDKIEMVSFVKPEDDEQEFKKLLEIEEKLVGALELPYQVVELASGDLAYPSARTNDIEIWFPFQNRYRETHSVSTTTNYQSRRLNIKYKNGEKTEFVHILNATAFAIGRTLIAILENYQQADGSVKIPNVLHEYLEKDIIQRPQ